MKLRYFLIFLVSLFASSSFIFILTYPSRYVITFSASGYNGDEEIRIDKNWGAQTVLPRTVLGNDFREFSITTWAPIVNLILHLDNLNSEKPPRQITILFGVVKVSRWNILGRLVDEADWLNLEAEYHTPDGDAYGAAGPTMATLRSGISGWKGYFVLRPPQEKSN